MSSKLLDTILSTLGRDDGLRRTYLQQRWQGLADATCHQPASGSKPRPWREMARAGAVHDARRIDDPRSPIKTGI
jgi:hypothetical protein